MAIEKVLVLGGTRFIGPAIVQNLRHRGLDVTVFHRGVNSAEIPISVDERIGDRMKPGAIADLVADVRPDSIIDTFAMTEETASITLGALKDWQGRLVMLSSCDVYLNFGGALGLETSEPSPQPIDEDSPLRTVRYPYRANPPRLASDPQAWRDQYDKIPVEEAYLSAGAVVLRLPMVFGPGDYQHRMAPYLKRMLDKRPFVFVPADMEHYVFPRGYIDNVAEAVAVAAMSDLSARIFNVADEKVYAELEWVQAIARTLSWDGEILLRPNETLPPSVQAGLVTKYGLEISGKRIRDDLGVTEVVDPTTAIARCVAWERDNLPDVQVDYAAEDSAKIRS